MLAGIEAIWQGVLTIGFGATVTALGILLVRRVAGKHVSPHWQFALWIVLLVRLLGPWEIPSPVSVFNVFPGTQWVREAKQGEAPPALPPGSKIQGEKALASPGAALSLPLESQGAEPKGPVSPVLPEARTSWDTWWQWSAGIWGFGVLCVLGYLLWVNLRFLRQVRACSEGDSALTRQLEDCKALLGYKGKRVVVAYTEAVEGPVVFGLMRPRILIPQAMGSTYQEQELQGILLHELAHVKYHHVPLCWLFTLLCAFHWFNPVLWYCLGRMKQDADYMADAAALRPLPEQGRRTYGQTLYRLAREIKTRKEHGLVMGMAEQSAVKGRILQALSFQHPKRLVSWGSVLVLLLLGCVFLTAGMPQSRSNVVVYVGEQGLAAMDLHTKEQVVLDPAYFPQDNQDWGQSNLVLNQDKSKVAYAKQNILYVVAVDFEGAPTPLALGPQDGDFCWQNEHTLVANVPTGGLAAYVLDNKQGLASTITLGEPQAVYTGLTMGPGDLLYGEKAMRYEKDDQEYIKTVGLVAFDTHTGAEQLILARNKDADWSYGSRYQIANMSLDGSKLYLFFSGSASLSTDGVPLGIYDLVQNRLQETEVFMLRYKDNLALDPQHPDTYAACVGGGREMSYNKSIWLAQGNDQDPEGMTISPPGYVAQTPVFSPFGREIVFTAAPEPEAEPWTPRSTTSHLYVYDLDTKTTEPLTQGEDVFDFYPFYDTQGQLLFLRQKGDQETMSLYRLENGQETELLRGIVKDVGFYGHTNPWWTFVHAPVSTFQSSGTYEKR